MTCPGCHAAMDATRLDGHVGTAVTVDVCHACQAFWFDAYESPRLSPGATLELFGVIGGRLERPATPPPNRLRCPACRAPLRLTRDRQRNTPFSYWRCPTGHGRFTTFLDFLREKDFVRPLSAEQMEGLRRQLQTVRCASCGAPVDLRTGSACAHCQTPLATLDLPHAEAVVEQLTRAAERMQRPVDPTLPLRLAQARREVETAFADDAASSLFVRDVTSSGLVGAALLALARRLRGA